MTDEKDRIPIGAKILTESLLQRAKEQLNETEEKKTESLKKMKSLIEESKLICSKEDDFLLRFLRVKKYNVDEGFATLTHYVRTFSDLKCQLGMLDNDLIKNALEKKVCILLPFRDAQGRAIIVYRAGYWMEEEVELEDALKAFIAVIYYLLEDPATQVGGILLIMDVEKFSFSETPYAVEYVRLLISLARFFPARFQRIDIVNEHYVFSTFMTMIKPFMPSKISKRVTLHGKEYSSLLKYYEEWMLPEAYGGSVKNFDNHHFLEEMDRVVEKLNFEIMLYECEENDD